MTCRMKYVMRPYLWVKALFIEHPTDKSNAVKVSQLSSFSLPWADPEKIPYTIMGPYLTPLFERAFIDGLRCH